MITMMEEHDFIITKLLEEKKSLQLQTDMVNRFKINKMGIWNIDKLMIMEDLK